MTSPVAVLALLGLLAVSPGAQATEVMRVAPGLELPVKPINVAAAGPQIVLLAPEDGGTYTSPVGIEIAFKPNDGAEIDLASLKVTVVSTTALGVFEMDITEDIAGYASKDGISAPDAEIPAGDHVVTIQVADSQKRISERRLSITVRDESVLERRAKE